MTAIPDGMLAVMAFLSAIGMLSIILFIIKLEPINVANDEVDDDCEEIAEVVGEPIYFVDAERVEFSHCSGAAFIPVHVEPGHTVSDYVYVSR